MLVQVRYDAALIEALRRLDQPIEEAGMTRITRAGFNKFFTIVSILAGLISLGLGLANSFDLLGSFPEASGPYVVFIWVRSRRFFSGLVGLRSHANSIPTPSAILRSILMTWAATFGSRSPEF